MKPLFRLVSAFISLLTVPAFGGFLFVDSASKNPTAPYDTWETAATSIQQAVDAWTPGSGVIVTNGVYPGGVIITNPIFLISYRGAQYTIIDGQGTNRCIWMTNGARLHGFTLTNGAAQTGGGVWCSSTNAFVTNCIIVGNTAADEGGGAWGGSLGRCTLIGNSAGSGGGAALALLENCSVISNSSHSLGGGGTFQSTVNNCLLIGNMGTSGGGASGGVLNNCTLSGNQANVGGGAVSAELNNSIIYFNSAPNGNNVNGCTLNYCCTTPSPGAGAGNIDLDPLFVDIADGNFRLRPPSPCVNTGNNALVVSSNGKDLDIQPRISGGRVDMGAYEFQAGALPVIVTQPLSQTIYSGTDVTFSAAAEGAQPLSWQWRFNGNAIPGQTNPTLTFINGTTNQNGSYSVVVTNFSGSDTSQSAVLTVVDAAPSITKQPLSQSVPPGNSITLSADAVGSLPMFWQWLFNGSAIPDATKSSLNVGPVASDQAGTYSVVVTNAFGKAVSSDAIVSLGPATGVTYVWQDSPNPTLPYTNWLTAAHSIPDAVSAAGANYQVIVTNGTYPGTVTIDKPLTLLSVNGPQVTVIDAGWNMGPAFDSGSVTMTDGASLSGFTITNGEGGANGVGVWCRSTNAFLTNCVLVGNKAWGGYGGGAHGGTLYNCMLIANMATNGGGAYNSTLINCVVSNNMGGGVSWCTLFNTLVISNTAYGGGGAVDSTLFNCTLIGNTLAAQSSRLYNCVAYYSTLRGSTNYDDSSIFNYCCTTPMPTNGVGNITNAPLFVSPADNDFHLQPDSPCINSGNNAYAPAWPDLDGNPRIVGGTVDIGAYESQAASSGGFHAWLQQYGLPTDGSADNADSDGDGMSNWQEWIAGTNPTNALSALTMSASAILSSSNTITGINVQWQSVSGVRYFLQRSTDLSGEPAFALVQTNLVGQAGFTSFVDTNLVGSGTVYYRVGVQQ